ncbi:MAG: hypothetical protein A2056_00500 [Deltaproteobacteria bacterium GWA2_42_85]|nr:MAG: hypothetical protein A2056_00500 [Deltaproteobacteria bacterium GWA2_42_85]OGP47992.1 MAG: hypothetical protein A2022_02935 [Deltaproteobacteria bacterium GWF2_42_12]
MAEVTIKIPDDIKDILGEINEMIYVEAVKEIARKKITYVQRRLKEMRKKIAIYEAKYGKSYGEFSQNVPDTLKGHDDWIEWSYLVDIADELAKKIEKLRFLIG